MTKNMRAWALRLLVVLLVLFGALAVDMVFQRDSEPSGGDDRAVSAVVTFGTLVILLILLVPWQLQALRTYLNIGWLTGRRSAGRWSLAIAAAGTLISLAMAGLESNSASQSVGAIHGIWLSAALAAAVFASMVPMSRRHLLSSASVPLAWAAIAVLGYRVSVATMAIPYNAEPPGLAIFLIPAIIVLLRAVGLLFFDDDAKSN